MHKSPTLLAGTFPEFALPTPPADSDLLLYESWLSDKFRF